MLARVGINRGDCYVTNVMKTRPPGNDFGSFYIDKKRTQATDALKMGIDELTEELKRLPHLRVIIALGAEPLKALTNKSPITSWRGSIIPHPIAPVIATFHPAGILRTYSNRTIAEFDLGRAAKMSYETLTPPLYTFTIQPSFETVITQLDIYLILLLQLPAG